MQTGDPVPSIWADDVSEVLIGSADIALRISQVAQALAHHYCSLNPLLLVVLKGSVMFAADLSRALPIPHELEFIRAKSYDGTQSTGTIHIQGLESLALSGRHVIVIEDIIDTGLTLRQLYNSLNKVGAASIKTCCLLEKDTARRGKDAPVVDHVLFRIPDKYVVGYGLDCDQRLRHLSFVGVYRQ